ncbi:MAG: hypothetical protein RR068_07130 [Hafnia sp.]
MESKSPEFEHLQSRINALDQAVQTLFMQVQATTQIAVALASTHNNPAAALAVFEVTGNAAEGTLQYSAATDPALAELDKLRALYRHILGSAQP